MNENEKIVTVPYLLTVKQASDYFNIGARVIRALADADVDYSFHMYNGNRLMTVSYTHLTLPTNREV